MNRTYKEEGRLQILLNDYNELKGEVVLSKKPSRIKLSCLVQCQMVGFEQYLKSAKRYFHRM